MPRTRVVLLSLHILTLLSGAGLSAIGVVTTVRALGAEPIHLSLPRGLASALLLALTAAFGYVLKRRGFSPIALPLFSACYVVLGFSVELLTRAWAKAFAPATLEEARLELRLGLVILAVELSLAIGAIAWAYRSARPLRNVHARVA